MINTASFVAVMGAATSQISYTASKGGVLALSRELGVEFARRGVRVNALCPGPVNTPLLQELFAKDPEKAARRLVHLPMGRFAEAREIANGALFLASDESSYVTAQTFLVDGGLSARLRHARVRVALGSPRAGRAAPACSATFDRRGCLGRGAAAVRRRSTLLMIFGGSMHVDQNDGHPWLTPEKQLDPRRSWSAARRSWACACGSQLLAEAAGAAPSRMPEPEIGWYEVEITDAGAADPVARAARTVGGAVRMAPLRGAAATRARPSWRERRRAVQALPHRGQAGLGAPVPRRGHPREPVRLAGRVGGGARRASPTSTRTRSARPANYASRGRTRSGRRTRGALPGRSRPNARSREARTRSPQGP